MTGHDGCGCGHSHAQTEQLVEAQEGGHAVPSAHGHEAHAGHGAHDHAEGEACADGACMDADCCGGMGAEGGCADGGCGCASAEGQLHPLEASALRGFLSGVHASRLDAARLADYLAQMGSDPSSEFGRPAQFLAEQLQSLAASGLLGAAAKDPPAWALLDAVAGPEGEDDAGDEQA